MNRDLVASTAKAAIVASGLWLAVWLAVGDGIRWLGYANAMGFFWGLMALCAGLILLAIGHRLFALPGVMLGAVIIAHGVPLRITAPDPEPAARDIRIVTASARGQNRDMAALARTVLTHRPDIVMLQEVSDSAALLAAVETLDRRQWHDASAGGLVTLSRWPVRKIDAAGGVLRVRIGAGATAITAWNLRAPKNYRDPLVNAHFHAALSESVEQQKPDIVAGDFNATPWNDGYGVMRRRMINAFDQAGAGTGFTFPSDARRMGALFAFVRIDHLFLAPGWTARQAMVGSASHGADHHPVIALVSPPTR